MTQVRSQLIPLGAGGIFHCAQRGVRRAYLCGCDQGTGRSIEHRKSRVEARIRFLAECFAVAAHTYAVMSNHLRLVMQVDPVHVAAWSDMDVAERWIRLFPSREDPDDARVQKYKRLISNPERLMTIRARLGNLAWFMRCLAEPIARRANREDGCTGRFWEGRFKVQLLCDERALLAANAYVNLNPIRAGAAKTLQESRHTGVSQRIAETKCDRNVLGRRLRPVLGSVDEPLAMITTDFLELLDGPGGNLRLVRKAGLP